MANEKSLQRREVDRRRSAKEAPSKSDVSSRSAKDAFEMEAPPTEASENVQRAKGTLELRRRMMIRKEGALELRGQKTTSEGSALEMRR